MVLTGWSGGCDECCEVGRTEVVSIGGWTASGDFRLGGSGPNIQAFSLASWHPYEQRFVISGWEGSDWFTIVSGRFDLPCCDYIARANAILLNGADIYIAGFFTGV